MDCGKKTLILLTLCALVGGQRLQNLINNLEVLVTVPSTNIGDTEIVSSIFSVRPGHPFMHTVVAQKNETRCVNSTDPLCSSTIKEPALDVSVSSRASNGKTFAYTKSFTGSMELVINVGPEVSVSPPQAVSGGSNGITVVLDVMYNQSDTRYGSLSTRRQPTIYTLNAEFITRVIGEDKDEENGQSTLRSAPLCALIVSALLPVLLFK